MAGCVACLFLLFSGAFAAAGSDKPLRIDGSTDQTAQKSYNMMLSNTSKEQQQELVIAMIKLNMKGVKSAHEVAGNQDLQSPSIKNIKTLVHDMTVEEIINLANEISDIQIKVQ